LLPVGPERRALHRLTIRSQPHHRRGKPATAFTLGPSSTLLTGRTYTTKPGGSLFFPILATPTGEAAVGKLTTEPGEHRGLMMPRRTRTRAEERNERIAAERRVNEIRIAEERRKRQEWLAANDESPPF